MAKSTQTKTKGSTSKPKAAFSNKNNGGLVPSKANSSKYQPGKDVGPEISLLAPTDGVLKLFTDCIMDIYWAENHLVKALPKMARATSLEVLQQALLTHLEETKTHVDRLEQVFVLLGKDPQAKKCDAMEGLTKEGEAVIETTEAGSPARNLGIILASQKVEHYEMASYTGMVKLADILGLSEVAAILSETLAEEEASDEKLAAIADENFSAMDESADDTEKD